MKRKFIYLTYYQVMAFLIEGEQIKQENQFFDDEIFSMFGNYACYRTYQASFIPENIRRKIPIYKISMRLFDYLERLTSIDVFDKEFMREYSKIINKKEEEIYNKLINGEYDYIFSNTLKKIKSEKK